MKQRKEQIGPNKIVPSISMVAGIFLLFSTWTPSAAQSASSGLPDLGDNASLHGKQIFPANNPWNQRIDAAPVDANSAAVINRFASAGLHADFGANWNGGPFGIPYRVVAG